MRLLFLRRLGGFSGGVLKTLDYFAHARTSGLVVPRMLLIPPRPWDDILENFLAPHEVVTEPGKPDLVFLSREWRQADDLGLTASNQRIIHLVQHAHGHEGTAEAASLARPATRIVVSRILADRIRQFDPNARWWSSKPA